MPTPGSVSFTIPAPLPTPPPGAVGHSRATVAVGDQLLSAALPGAVIPSGTNNPKQYPFAVSLQVEVADALNLTFVTFDGTATAASATNGVQVPVAPSLPLRIPYPAGLKSDAGTIRACATVGTAHLQCFFEYLHT